MKIGVNRTFIWLLAALFLVFWTSAGCGATDGTEAEADKPRETADHDATLATLGSITETIASLTEQLKAREKELKTAATQDQKAQITNDINEISRRLREVEAHFEQIAAGVDMQAFQAREEEKFNLRDEMQALLGPILQELKSVTARPREIERLRSLVEEYRQRARIAKEAVQKVRGLLAAVRDESVKKELGEVQKSLKDKEQEISNQLSVYEYQLKGALEGKTSFWQTIQNVLLVFFRSRGRNLLLAMAAFALVFLLLRYIHLHVYRLYPILQSPRRSFFARLVDVIYHAMTVLAAALASLFVLYISGDWVLLGLALFFIFGLAWTAKNTLPRYYEQAKLLLNLGGVREGERIVYGGLPWKVQSLNVYTRLVNPTLTGGMARVPLKELAGLSSRPFEPDEPWFPCKENDWVILADGTRGKVVVQTPEMVQLILLGGSRKTYPTLEFLKQNPNNISTNFRIKATLGIDYSHQSIITGEIPIRLRKVLLERLSEAGYGDEIIKIQVEFKEAAASSLDLEILADFSGRAAKAYETLGRAIQKIAVDACNDHGWVIPFPQVVVHHASEPALSAPQ